MQLSAITDRGGSPSPHQAHRNAAQTPSNQPGRSACSAHVAVRHASASAVRHSASMRSGSARAGRLVAGAEAANQGPVAGRMVACASHRQTSTTPAVCQSGSASELSRRSAAAQTATKTARSTRRLLSGIRSTSAAVTSIGTSSGPAPTVRREQAGRPNPADLHVFPDSPARACFVLLGTGWGQRTVLRRSRSAASLDGQDGGPGA